MESSSLRKVAEFANQNETFRINKPSNQHPGSRQEVDNKFE
jgi:hypothetical protein